MDSKRILQLQKDFSYIHLITGLVFVLYFMIRGVKGYDNIIYTISSIGIILVLALVDYLFSKYDYWSNMYFILGIRILQIMACSVFAVFGTTKGMVSQLACVCYGIFVMEISYIYQNEIPKLNRNAVIYMQIPLIIVTLIGIFNNKITSEEKLGLIFWAVISIVVSTHISYRIYKEVLGSAVALRYQRRLTREAQNNNLLMLTNQREMRLANEELLAKKEELEEAYKRINQSNSEMMVQNMIQRYISTSLELDSLLPMITESISEAMAITCCGILVRNEDSEQPWKICVYSILGKKATAEYQAQILDKSFLSRFEYIKEHYIDNNMDFEQYPFLGKENVGSLLVFPLNNDDKMKGLLIVEKNEKNFFGKNIAFFDSVATQLIIAINNAKLYQKMEDMAMKDGLTGIYNRAYLNKMIMAHRTEKDELENLVVILFDIDNFKCINDRFGHLFGDTVIQLCAITAKKLAKEYGGMAARYGGEEFVILLKNKSNQELYEIVEKLHRRISSNELEYEGEKITIHISGGVATYPESCKEQKDLLNHADWAMYYSKENGKGYTTFDSQELRRKMKRSRM
ncbi:sensor domain-containing diguanylate cyclase [Anaerosacchariphilus polymeriproducens]|uniref:Diguanylate cyclase n=1 Tax=Anaerosacchariphilus polymeriproducens TaxID=1812858 RepID=A0A371ATJ5_9FIRM|nr:sensor domain-containing diguanylate cyclase [Anaerosacchariphilus polymeriproducens]RDU22895.1 diguanylate cyclase [Anaerosacchariphilus polymeriproducens]